MLGTAIKLGKQNWLGESSILGLSGMSYWVAGTETDSQNLSQLGPTTGAGDAQFGSTSGAASNDPTALDWSGTDYLWFPGTAGNTLSVARPVASVDVVITYDDDSTDSSLTAQTDDPLVFGGTDVLFADLNIKSIQLKNSSGGAEVGLFQAVNATQSGETDSYSNVWSIARSSSGLKSTLVTRPVIVSNSAAPTQLNVADHADLNFSNSDDFTVWVYGRVHHASSDMVQFAKRTSYSAGVGWALVNRAASSRQFRFGDGTVNEEIAKTVTADGSAYLHAGVRNVTADNYDVFVGSFGGTPNTDDTISAIENPSKITVASLLAFGAPSDLEIFAFGVLKGTALTADQLASLKTELDTLLGGRVGE